MNITAVYIVRKKLNKVNKINKLTIQKLVSTGKAVYHYAFPKDLDYLIELDKIASGATGVILFRISDSRIPPSYTGNDISPCVSDYLLSDHVNNEKFYEVCGTPVAEITFSPHMY